MSMAPVAAQWLAVEGIQKTTSSQQTSGNTLNHLTYIASWAQFSSVLKANSCVMGWGLIPFNTYLDFFLKYMTNIGGIVNKNVE